MAVTPRVARFAYAANAGDDTISVYAVDDETGRFVHAGYVDSFAGHPGRRPDGGARPVAVAVDPAGRYLFVANAGAQAMSSFAIEADGTLERVGLFPPTDADPIAIVVHPNGRFVYVLNGDAPSGSVFSYTMDPRRGLDDTGHQGLLHATVIAVHPAGGWLYVAGHGTSTGFVVGRPGTDPRHPVGAHSGPLPPYAAVLPIDPASGRLGPATAPIALPGTGSPTAIAVHPSGNFAYVTMSESDSSPNGAVVVCSIDPATGGLLAPSTLPISGGDDGIARRPTAFAVSGDGSRAWVACAAAASSPGASVLGLIVPFQIGGGGGALQPGVGAATGGQPTWIGLSEPASRLYVYTNDESRFAGYSWQPATGELAALAACPLAQARFGANSPAIAYGARRVRSASTVFTLPRFMSTNPDIGVFATAAAGDSLPGTGTAVGGEIVAQSAVSTGDSPDDMAAHPAGRLLYVINGLSKDMALVAVNGPGQAQRHSLTPPVTFAEPPLAVTVDSSGRFVYVASGTAIHGFVVGPAGQLRRIMPATPFSNATVFAVDPNGRCIYAARHDGDRQPGSLTRFAIDRRTGALAAQESMTVGLQPTAIAIHPTGQFLYAANFGDSTGVGGSVFIISLDALTGRLQSASSGPTFANPKFSPYGLDIDPGGTLAYIAGVGPSLSQGRVKVFAVDPQSGFPSDTGVEHVMTVASRAVRTHPTATALYVGTNASGQTGQVLLAFSRTMQRVSSSPRYEFLPDMAPRGTQAGILPLVTEITIPATWS